MFFKIDIRYDFGYIKPMDEMPKDAPKMESLSDLLWQARFRIRHLSEAHLLAEFLSNTCPNPRLNIIGLTEIFINAIEHGNLGISFEEKSKLQLQENWLEEIDRRLNLPEHRDQFVEIFYERLNDEIHVTVTDQGKGFDWKKYQTAPEKDANFKDSHGRGILLAKKLAFKELRYAGNGNQVTCIIAI